MPTELGTLEPIDLRTIWPDEARDVTPWLAQEDNLRRLSEALNLELELDRLDVGRRVANSNKMETAVGQSVGRVPSRGAGDAASLMRRVRGPGLLFGPGRFTVMPQKGRPGFWKEISSSSVWSGEWDKLNK